MPRVMNKLLLREMRNAWPEVNASVLSEKDAREFRRRKCAVDLYIDGVALSEIEGKTVS